MRKFNNNKITYKIYNLAKNIIKTGIKLRLYESTINLKRSSQFS